MNPTSMKNLLPILFFIFPLMTIQASSSIRSVDLPQAPSNRYAIQESETQNQEELIWYAFYRYYLKGEEQVKHGLWIERTRSRDRERFNTDFTEVRKIFYEGKASTHSVESTWIDGVLRERIFILNAKLKISVKYNAQGQEIMGPKAKARGGLAKRERITRVFNDVYELNE